MYVLYYLNFPNGKYYTPFDLAVIKLRLLILITLTPLQ
jgi:hypothetical protein